MINLASGRICRAGLDRFRHCISSEYNKATFTTNEEILIFREAFFGGKVNLRTPYQLYPERSFADSSAIFGFRGMRHDI